ncbi:MAG: lipase [Rhodococcus sp.]|nr:lipase [Rhodococcus sp. (in: high G+C Gram-positive bacteria)]
MTPTSGKEAVLLVGGVGFGPYEAWSWGYAKALPREGFGVCTVAIPNHGRGDATIGAAYVVNAIRYAREQSGRQVDVVAHSAGPALALWAMRFWPDVATSVDDMVVLAAPIHGTLLANAVCAVGFCPALAHQLSYGSDFTAALNRAPLRSSISVTSIFSLFDEGIQPAREVSSYPGAANIALQDHCPGRLVEHVSQMFDAAAYRLVIDALTHPGPAVPTRTARLCEGIALPAFALSEFVPPFVQGSINYVGILGEPSLPAAPPLPAYALKG